MKEYFRPIVQNEKEKPPKALSICGTDLWFSQVEVITRSGCLGLKSVNKFPCGFFKDITLKRKPIGNVTFANPIPTFFAKTLIRIVQLLVQCYWLPLVTIVVKLAMCVLIVLQRNAMIKKPRIKTR